MTILADSTIKQLCTGECNVIAPDAWSNGGSPGSIPKRINNHGVPMIDPFVGELKRYNDAGQKIISYGLSSYGYDVRLKKDEVKLFTNVNSAVVDPMAPDEKCYINAQIDVDENGLHYFILPPNSYALASTVEYFHIPENVSVICVGKSTYARSCVIVNTTPIEAGFEGEVTIEISNGSGLPVKVYLGSGIAQFLFFQGDVICETTYANRNGKYQGQRGITLSRT